MNKYRNLRNVPRHSTIIGPKIIQSLIGNVEDNEERRRHQRRRRRWCPWPRKLKLRRWKQKSRLIYYKIINLNDQEGALISVGHQQSHQFPLHRCSHQDGGRLHLEVHLIILESWRRITTISIFSSPNKLDIISTCQTSTSWKNYQSYCVRLFTKMIGGRPSRTIIRNIKGF